MTEISRRHPIIKDQYYYKGDLNTTQQNTAVDNECTGVKPMYYESNRLRSFTNWPSRYQSPAVLAKHGFYFVHVEDHVKCAFCNIELGKWEENDSIERDHRRFSPNCPFINNKAANIPLGSTETTMPQQGEDTCGKFGLEVRPNSCTEREKSDYNKLNLPNIGKTPAFPNRTRLESRVETFKHWPISITQRPQELAEAGFYYTGKSDHTLCFFCGGGLKNWVHDDDPWEQHALWFSKCNYLILQKGYDFIAEVCNKYKAVLTQSEALALSTPSEEKPVVETKETNVESKAKLESSVDKEGQTSPSGSLTTLCKICYDKEIGMVFLPCGHICTCIDCATGLGNCAVCRKPIEATTRVFLS